MHESIYKIPFGPQHPGLIEPTCLELYVEGHYIKDSEIRLGYVHRGLEKMLEGKSIGKTLYLVERVCGLCGGAYAQCFSQAIERAAKIEVPKGADFVRTIINELERIQSHLLWASFMAHDVGYDTLFMFFMRERERVLEVIENITGARVHKANITIGGVRYGIQNVPLILNNLSEVERHIKKYAEVLEKDSILSARLKEVGVVSKKEALKYCLVGPVARGSGVDVDIRKLDPYAAYGEIDFSVVLDDGCDALARAKVRLKEILESIEIIKRAIAMGPLEEREKRAGYVPSLPGKVSATSRVEAPRGELFQFLLIEDNKIKRIKLRPPTLANISILTELLKGREIGDVPVIIGSLDPCFACMERVIIVDTKGRRVLNEEEFRKCIK